MLEQHLLAAPVLLGARKDANLQKSERGVYCRRPTCRQTTTTGFRLMR